MRDLLRWSFCSVVDGAGGVGGEFGVNGARTQITEVIIDTYKSYSQHHSSNKTTMSGIL